MTAKPPLPKDSRRLHVVSAERVWRDIHRERVRRAILSLRR